MYILDHIKFLNILTNEINEVLRAHSIEIITQDDIQINNNKLSLNKKLSNVINNYIWPPVNTKDVYHFTNHSETIFSDNKFRLYSIAKNYTAHEVETFCKAHKMTSWLKNDAYKDDMANSFIGCFSDTNICEDEEAKLWRTFAANDGVRLKFRITAQNEDFRRIKYEKITAQPIQILAQLDAIAHKHNLKLFRQRLTTLAAFYLPAKDYEYENEYRVLYRIWPSSTVSVFGSGIDSYIEIPLNDNTLIGFKLDLLECCANTKSLNLPSNCVYSLRVR